MYSGGVEPRPYGVVGVGLCSTRIDSAAFYTVENKTIYTHKVKYY